jgi:hypothetical protein
MDARQGAFQDMGDMRLDWLSGDPNLQANVFGHFLRQSAEAVEAGQVGFDPTLTAAETFVRVLAEKHQGAYQALVAQVAPKEEDIQRKMLRGVFARAVAANSENLKRSTAWVAKELFGSHEWLEKPDQAPDPVSDREARLVEREQAIQARDEQAATGAWQRFQQDTSKHVNGEVDKTIDGVLGEVKEFYKEFPQRLKNLHIRLREEVKQAIQSDSAWRQSNQQLYRQAQLAVSGEQRQNIQKKLAERYSSRAQQVLDRVKNEIFSEDAQLLKEQSAAKRKRQEDAQGRRGPSGVSSPVKPSVPADLPKGHVDRETWGREMDKIFD